jgi:hypothetical protein
MILHGFKKKVEGKDNNNIVSGSNSLPFKLYFLLPLDKAQSNTICLSNPVFFWLTPIGL